MFVPVDTLFVERRPQLVKDRVLGVPCVPQRHQSEYGNQLMVGDMRQRGYQPFAQRVEQRIDETELATGRVHAHLEEIVAHVVGRPQTEVLRDQTVELLVGHDGQTASWQPRVRVDDRLAVRRVVHHRVVRVVVLLVQVYYDGRLGGRRVYAHTRRRRRSTAVGECTADDGDETTTQREIHCDKKRSRPVVQRFPSTDVAYGPTNETIEYARMKLPPPRVYHRLIRTPIKLLISDKDVNGDEIVSF